MWSFAALVLLGSACHLTFGTQETLVRKNVDELTSSEILNLELALDKLEQETGSSGYQSIAGMHGAPPICDYNGQKIACCIHGMPTFPHWHRLYVVQMERALERHGLTIGMPFWDWTRPITKLPSLVEDPIFIDPEGGKAKTNSWHSGDVQFMSTHTARAVDPRMFEKVEPGHYTQLFEATLDALEQEEYCQFEIQFEVSHNTMHYLTGGRYMFSMSTLEYTSYDPIFFLHHSNVDRIFAIWQELQKARGKPWDHSNCAVQMFQKELEPFNRDSNTEALTKSHATAASTFDYNNLGYSYADLTLNDLDVTQLEQLLQDRKSTDRLFASFRLAGIGISANVQVILCLPSDDPNSPDHCEHVGDFFILGGPTEMPWAFSYPYYFDVTKSINKFDGADITSDFYAKYSIQAVNGTDLPANSIPDPEIIRKPGASHVDPTPRKADPSKVVTRKNINQLTKEEIFKLRLAFDRWQMDTSVEGFQAIAEYHGVPARCPSPDAKDRWACCTHGMPTFPHWHRLFMSQMEDAIVARGSPIGVPYWDWALPMTELPHLATDPTYSSPDGTVKPNPFYNAKIAFESKETTRDVLENLLYEKPKFGDHTYVFDAMIFAFEQEDFCDFEIPFEVVHNAMHLWVGGKELYSMSHLHYTAFDPIFYLHHSNVDRLWAIWQALQIRRGKSYEAHCAKSEMAKDMKPFSFKAPFNNNVKTQSHAKPNTVYDYENELGYTYDSLQFGGMNLNDLESYIHQQKKKDRTFAGFKLGGIKTSANVEVFVTKEGGSPFRVGTFPILGGALELKWAFDRPYMFEITNALVDLGLVYSDSYSVSVIIKEFDGTPLDASLLPKPIIIYKPADDSAFVDKDHLEIRKNVEQLTPQEQYDLRTALAALKEDKTASGFQQMAAFHGQPNWCPTPDAPVKYACCVHGMATFPHWHRLLTVMFENGLRRNGYTGALPYWEWTRPQSALPDLAKDEKYTDPISGEEKDNPWYKAHIDESGTDTIRKVNQLLFEQPSFGKYTQVSQQILLALEQDDFCDFEVQYEIAHNLVHALVGGDEVYSMSSLRYTAYDPIFFLHHSMTDRIWAIWQALQKYRGKPYNSANCALREMREPLSPFGLSSDVNPDGITRDHAIPFSAFNYESSFSYRYDNLDFNGLSIAQLSKELNRIRSKDRVFVGFLLHGLKFTTEIKFSICKGTDMSDCTEAGVYYIFGDEFEMPWQYDRLYKYEITKKLAELNLRYDDSYHIAYTIYKLDGTILGTDNYGTPTIIHDRGSAEYGEDYLEPITASSNVRKNMATLNDGEIESLRAAFQFLHDDGTFGRIAQFHGFPGLCDGIACCIHGMPTFPHWHRLYVLQLEGALKRKGGSSTAIPYWDWTIPMTEIPKILSDATFYNSRQQRFDPNPLFSAKIDEDTVSVREPKPELFDSQYFYENTLLAFEQESFCDFEIQYEITHNAFHLWLGGRSKYSMSSLDYSAYDPAFFMYHSNTDRLWAIWQELQRYRKKPYNTADCAVNQMHVPLKPYNRKANPNVLTLKYNTPSDIFDYQNNLLYKYDSLEFNHMNIPELEDVLVERKKYDRTFVGILLQGIKSSAEITLYVCVPSGRGEMNCNNKAGVFCILGGPLEMPFLFDRLYKFDITPTLHRLGIDLQSHSFDIKFTVIAPNGTVLDPEALRKPTILFKPGTNSHQSDDGQNRKYVVRKNINNLSPQETISLVKALKSMQADSSADGYQSIAAFHALPPLCPSPSASKRYACCVHGMATFPQWHRLYTVQFGESLMKHGAPLCIPYWDWTRPQKSLPDLLTKDSFIDPVTGQALSNPWKKASIDFEGDVETARDLVIAKLFPETKQGYKNWFYEQVIFALEQENYCDFEIQFEILHNGVHLWIGGQEEKSMSHLHYTSYDPSFYIHHSETDRIWAIWQELQKYRGLDGNEANCALEMMKEPLKPFSFGPPWNLNKRTKEYSKPADAFNYKEHFGYIYDSLDFMGMTIQMLDSTIKGIQLKDRIFVGFLLKGFGLSANVDFQICDSSNNCKGAGYFAVLGGSEEMPWNFDRLYKYDITEVMKDLNLHHDDPFTVKATAKAVNGTDLGNVIIGTPSTIFVPGKDHSKQMMHSSNSVRRDISSLDSRSLQNLISSLTALQEDSGADGFAAISSFHGLPSKCPDASNPKYACCVHGMPAFPLWHRLYMVQFELALKRHGSFTAMPYWDWTYPITKLPSLLTDPSYYDAVNDRVIDNPWARGRIPSEETHTVRDLQGMLYETSADGKHSVLFEHVIYALEQTDYCDFEVQFEVVHNWIHYLIGGRQEYSLSSLHWTSYDPMFYIHHAFVDKLFAVWQAIQKDRGLPNDRADCAVNQMKKSMHPFDMDINVNKFTKAHALPQQNFDYHQLGYSYDNLNVGGYNIEQLEAEIEKNKHKTRIFAGFLLYGINSSADVQFEICKGQDDCYPGGSIFILGGTKEMPWAFDRMFKYDITAALQAAGISPSDVFNTEEPFHFKVIISDMAGKKLPPSTLPAPTILFEPSEDAVEKNKEHAQIRKNVDNLTPEDEYYLRKALAALKEDTSAGGFQQMAAFHGQPNWCPTPDAAVKYACCVHGMATFPHWHRLLTVQFEDGLRRHGYTGAVPYWEWTRPLTKLPHLAGDEKYDDPITGQSVDNSWYKAHIDESNTDTARQVDSRLYQQPAPGHYTLVTQQILLALEQDDFCSFEVQYEIAHNLIHALVGGTEVYSMGSLRYTAYDPIFFLHHSMTDRIWAIWQELQKFRGKAYNTANCALAELREPLTPFSLSSDVNPYADTKKHSVPFDVFNYKSSFGYIYDNLEFNGMSIPELAKELNRIGEHNRVFAGFILHGIKYTAMIKFDVCPDETEVGCRYGGEFYLLGDEYEMPWHYDRLYKYELTEVLEDMNLRYNDTFHISYKVSALDGTDLGKDPFGTPTIIHDAGSATRGGSLTAASRVRKNLNSLSEDETESLRHAMQAIHDDGEFEDIAKFHGYPGMCDDIACCVHGMPTFPHWHRLHVLQLEGALLKQGTSVSLPYWDYTVPFAEVPHIMADATYYNSKQQRYDTNPFFSGKISGLNKISVREPMSELYNSQFAYENMLLAFEQESFCDFEIQYEITHNAIHLWLGGPSFYSMSSLDFSAFDPAFFLYHSNTDRLWAIWQELQKYRNKPYNSADCAIHQMHTPLKPFNRADNKNPLTHATNKPDDIFNYQENLSYKYDTLEYNGMSIPELNDLLEERQRKDRTFVEVMLHGIKSSAHVDVYLCVPTGRGRKNCNNKAGTFSILGGPLEMPFEFDRPFKVDITSALTRLGIDLQSRSFDVKLKIVAPDGHVFNSDALKTPTVTFVAGTDSTSGSKSYVSHVRKNMNSLSDNDVENLRVALQKIKDDGEYRVIADYHGYPGLCNDIACCVHGMPTFPHWHRVHVMQFEGALLKHGSHLFLPYWDWTKPMEELPRILSDHRYFNTKNNRFEENPFHTAHIHGENTDIVREPTSELYHSNYFYENIMYAFEQESFCDFEVQFEITHNAIHLWLGGKSKFSMSSLEYSAFDPAFYLYHANTDRMWAIWQELQRIRNKPYNSADCGIEMMHVPMAPFDRTDNTNTLTHTTNKPEDVFDYQKNLNYKYDTLEFNDMSISQLEDVLEERKKHDRTFVGFMLAGIKSSAEVTIYVCVPTGHGKKSCDNKAGVFTILGGPLEMPFAFDRPYKFDITSTLDRLGIELESESFDIKLRIVAPDGTTFSEDSIAKPTIIFTPGTDHGKQVKSTKSVRHEISSLDGRAQHNLISSLKSLVQDSGPDGFQAISAFHGLPAKCGEYACCIHGMASFPLWHRLYVRQFESALERHGSVNAVPYWDWTVPVTALPSLMTDESYYDAKNDKIIDNPWVKGYIESENIYTVRDVQDMLYKTTVDGSHSLIFEQVLLALEQKDFCDFEVQYEVIHNWIHFLIGGREEHSLSSLHWTSYDPIFYVHHSFVDKLLAVWQELQKRRNMPHDRADCAVNLMVRPMHPFNMDINVNEFTKAHSLPKQNFDYENLGYTYDNLNIGGYTLEQLEDLIEKNKKKTRVYAGFLLNGILSSASVNFEICKTDYDCYPGGFFFILGGTQEMPWAYDRLFKYDITDALEAAGVHASDVFDAAEPFHFKLEITDIAGKRLPASSIYAPTIVYEPCDGADVEEHAVETSTAVRIRKEVNSLTHDEMKNLRKALAAVQADNGPNGFQAIAKMHGAPPQCEMADGTMLACCHHGMATFPHWHRLYTKQMEDALVASGATVGIPYWDWTESFTKMPTFVTEENDNSWHHGNIEYLGRTTSRYPRPQLFSDPENGDESFFYRQVLLILEQTDYCAFEVQFEVTHNAIHLWTGGRSIYGMSTLGYTSYDPLFYLHHTYVDKIWAIWQALQRYRGLPYNEAYCEIQDLKHPLRPFSDDSNPNPETKKYSTAFDSFNYHNLNYQYDDLKIHGMSISELDTYLNKRKQKDRVFVDFLLKGFKLSADVEFEICTKGREVCKFGGTFAVLGGPEEMPWAFDRLYQYDVTNVMKELGLRYDSDLDIVVKAFGIDGTELDGSVLHAPTMEFVPGTGGAAEEEVKVLKDDKIYRKEVRTLSLDEANQLRSALTKFQNDDSKNGFEHIAGFHGAPNMCPETGDKKYACCMHGMAVFPHWHRLFTIQFERALASHGSTVGMPYWDWTKPFSSLPSLFSDSSSDNPFYKYHIKSENHDTERDLITSMYNSNELYKETLEVLGEDNYCDFEVQYEILHNAIHYYIGGSAAYGMSTLAYSSFDPFFMIHHSSIDRLWIIWQQLQRLRNKPYNSAACAGKMMEVPLQPFSYATVNDDEYTRKYSDPESLFDQEHFGYWYDTLTLHDQSLTELYTTVTNLTRAERLYAGFVLSGIQTTVAVDVWVSNDAGTEEKAGQFIIFGGEKEIPWAYERIYKMDITNVAKKLSLHHDSTFTFRTTMTEIDGTAFTTIPLPDPVIVHRPANVDHDIVIIPVGAGKHLPAKISVKRGTYVEFHGLDESVHAMIDLGSYTTFYNCVVPPFGYNMFNVNKPYSLRPGEHFFTAPSVEQCKASERIQIHVDDY